MPAAEKAGLVGWLRSRLDLIALGVIALGLVVRAMTAATGYLYPDEALHYLLANQPSVIMAYKASLTTAHPPLFILLLYLSSFLGESEFILRLPSLVSGTAFLWVAFKWLGNVFGQITGLVGVILLTFSPPMISLSAEVRGYSTFLLFMASALYFIDRAFEEKSPRMVVFFSLFLYLAILTEYSALWFTISIGIYALMRILRQQPPPKVVGAWVGFQVGALVIYACLYVTSISKLQGSALEQDALGHWLTSSYFHSSQDNLLLFSLNGTVEVFQYLSTAWIWRPLAQSAVGIAMFLLFLAGLALLLIKGVLPARNKPNSLELGIFLLLPFVIGCGAAIAGTYPYGGTRHTVFLALPAAAGVSFLLAELVGKKLWPALLVAVLVMVGWNMNATRFWQHIQARHQSRILVESEVNHIRQSISPGSLIFVDDHTRLVLLYYLGKNQKVHFDGQRFVNHQTKISLTRAESLGKSVTIRVDEPGEDFLEFPHGGYRIISSRLWRFQVDSFGADLRRMGQAYGLDPRELVWVVEVRGVNLYRELTRRFPESYLPDAIFGNILVVFQVPTGLEPLRRR
jgi:hypothetical protein